MDGITIQINWIYFLGIIGALIGVAWYSGSRFSKIETDIEWLKRVIGAIDKGVDGLKVDFENKKAKLFGAHSPVKLTAGGDDLLRESGLKAYIDNNSELVNVCKAAKCDNAYEVQQHAFDLFDSLPFEEKFEKQLKQFVFDRGLSMEILRRVGGIYYRDVCLNVLQMNAVDIDKHDPGTGK